MSVYAYQCFTCRHLMSDHRGKHPGPDEWPLSYKCLHCPCVISDDDHPTLPLTKKQFLELREVSR